MVITLELDTSNNNEDTEITGNTLKHKRVYEHKGKKKKAKLGKSLGKKKGDETGIDLVDFAKEIIKDI